MLQSFRGTIDVNGIRSLRLERDDDVMCPAESAVAEFWVVLNHAELPTIRATIQAGDRIRAMSLLCERAVSLGSILPE